MRPGPGKSPSQSVCFQGDSYSVVLAKVARGLTSVVVELSARRICAGWKCSDTLGSRQQELTCGGWPCRRHAIPDSSSGHLWCVAFVPRLHCPDHTRRRSSGGNRGGLGVGCGGVHIALVVRTWRACIGRVVPAAPLPIASLPIPGGRRRLLCTPATEARSPAVTLPDKPPQRSGTPAVSGRRTETEATSTKRSPAGSPRSLPCRECR